MDLLFIVALKGLVELIFWKLSIILSVFQIVQIVGNLVKARDGRDFLVVIAWNSWLQLKQYRDGGKILYDP